MATKINPMTALSIIIEKGWGDTEKFCSDHGYKHPHRKPGWDRTARVYIMNKVYGGTNQFIKTFKWMVEEK